MTDKSKPIRTRLAPSPTGFVHVGTVRTGLFNFLYSRHFGGKTILRVEDTDQTRLVEGAMENMISVMKTLGIEFDEGPFINETGELKERGEFGPYIQSNRLGIYKEHIQILLDKKSAYHCFCSPERLDELRKDQMALKKPAMYDRHCRNLNGEELAAKLQESITTGKNPVVRFACPSEGETVVSDLVFGEMTFQNNLLDDQVLIKSDGFPTYHFAVVVDDHLMEISHVIRGEEWIPSTPKHIMLYQAFGWEVPAFAHMPLILNPDKSKLSKRQGDVAAEDFLQKGYLPEALVNFIAFLGWNPKTEQEIFSIQELVEQFELSKVNKSAAVFDLNKLDWMNAEYIRTKTNPELVELCYPYWQDSGQPLPQFDQVYLEAVVALEKDRLKKLSDIADGRTDFYFKIPEYDSSILVWKKSTAEETKHNLTLLGDLFRITDDEVMGDPSRLEETIKAFITEHEMDNGSVLWPLRVAMTGLEKSPGPFEVTATLFKGWGRAHLDERLTKAVSLL